MEGSASNDNTVKKRKTRRDLMLIGAIVLAVGVLAAAMLPFINGMIMTRNFQEFKDRYGESMLIARSINRAELVKDGELRTVTADAASQVYNLILTAGMGKVQKQVPEGEPAELRFKNGAVIKFWESEIPEKSARTDVGLFIRYEEPDGYIYMYDTDKLTMKSINNILK